MLNARPRSRDEGRPVERPFPPFAPSLSSSFSFLPLFLPSSRLVQPFRGTVTRARVTQRDAWLFSRFFFPSLPPLVPSLFLYSPSFFSSARLPNSCAIVDIRERWRTSSFFSLESAGSARARGPSDILEKKCSRRQPHAICPRSVCACACMSLLVNHEIRDAHLLGIADLRGFKESFKCLLAYKRSLGSFRLDIRNSVYSVRPESR